MCDRFFDQAIVRTHARTLPPPQPSRGHNNEQLAITTTHTHTSFLASSLQGIRTLATELYVPMAAPVYRALISYFQEQEQTQEQRGGREGNARGHGNDHHDHDHDELPGLVVADVAAIGALWYSHRTYPYALGCFAF